MASFTKARMCAARTPPWPGAMAFSVTMMCFAFFKASRMASLGKGRNEPTRRRPIFSPAARFSSIMSFSVPMSEPIATAAAMKSPKPKTWEASAPAIGWSAIAASLALHYLSQNLTFSQLLFGRVRNGTFLGFASLTKNCVNFSDVLFFTFFVSVGFFSRIYYDQNFIFSCHFKVISCN